MPAPATPNAASAAGAPAPAGSPIFPTLPEGFGMPFYYAALTSMWVFYRADYELVAGYLKGTGMRAARFDGTALVSLDFQSYASGNATMPFGGTREVEFSVHAYPETREAQVPEISLVDYLMGGEQTKTIGRWLLHVPCDNPFAVRAGIELFEEPKFNTTFDTNIPSLNSAGVAAWQYTVNDPQEPTPAKAIYALSADVSGVRPVPANCSPIPEYGTRDGRLICAWWNLLGTYDTYLLDSPATQGGVRLTLGKSPHPMRADVQKLIGAGAAVAVQVFQSPPAAAEGRPWFVD